jgi:hypothetical protein
MPKSLVGALKGIDEQLFVRLQQDITCERLYRYLKPLADTPAPSQTVSQTRAQVLEGLLREDGLLAHSNLHYDRNYRKTGNAAILLGKDDCRKQVWMLAHLDVVSYFVHPPRDGRYPLVPYCYHLMPAGRRAEGQVLEFSLETRKYEVAAYGEIVTEADGSVFFEPRPQAVLRAGQRVCFHSEMTWDRESGQVRGCLDDAGGAVPLTLAAGFLADYDVELLLGLTDEEEGPGGVGSQTFCRGGPRLLRFFDQPDLVIDSDGQAATAPREGNPPLGLAPGDGACFAEQASKARGTITPPHLYELQRQLGQELAAEGIHLRENRGGYVSRTEGGVSAMLRTPNVVLLGFLSDNAHFETDVGSANIHDLVDLARAAVCYALLTRTEIWQEVMGGR